METKGAALRTALQLIPRRTNLANAFVFNGRVEWQFSQTSDGRRHFWSTDDIECLWCRRRRTPAEIALWRQAGEPKEECR